ncbi:MAG TPA: DsbA family protein [Actinomycetota bacterium]|nr:DsbA family protein [Actinomycetota bacterium]
MALVEEREIIYVGDPMCSWCWGFAPELDELCRRFPTVGLRVVTGGLRPGPDAQPMSDRLAGFLESEWSQIEQHTGQPFDHGLLARRDWIYDTEPACRAVAIMRSIDEPLAWPLFKRIQRAFYAEGILPLDRQVLAGLVDQVGGDASAFAEAFDSERFAQAAWADFAQAREWGVASLPTVIARVGDQGYLLTIGYTTAEVMAGRLPAEIAGPAEPPA